MRTLLATKPILLLVPVVAAGTGFVAYEHRTGNPPVRTEVAGNQVVKTGDPGDTDGQFTLAGGAGGLFPGARLPLTVTLSNPQSFGIHVTSVTVSVADPAPRPGVSSPCTAAAVEIGLPGGPAVPAGGSVPLSVDIPGKGAASAGLEVRMVADPPDTCQGASFGLAYGGTAVKS